MRVAINGYFWDRPRTGSGQYLRHLWEALPGVMGGDDSLVMLLPPSITSEPVPVGGGREAYRFRKPWLVGVKNPNLDKMLWESRGVLRAALRLGADLLHVPYLAAPWFVRAPLSVVVTAHDMIPWVVPGYSGSPAVRVYLEMAAQAARRADLVLADSEASRRDVLGILKMPESRVRTVYLGVEAHPRYSESEIAEVRSRYNLPPDFSFYLGGFDRRKNVPLLLRAWRAFVEGLGTEWCAEDKPLLAIGGALPEPGGIFPDIRGEVERLGLRSGQGGTVRFLGQVSEEDKPLLMAAARVFIYPSAYEGFGLDPLEAMSVGCAVVSSSGGSLEEVVGDGGLLVPPGDEDALRQAIFCVWTDGSIRAGLAGAGRERASRFTWERTAEQTLDAYRAVLARGKRTETAGNVR